MNSELSSDLEPKQRIAEMAEILAVGLQRLIQRQSSEKLRVVGDSSLQLSPDQSSYAPQCSKEVS